MTRLKRNAPLWLRIVSAVERNDEGCWLWQMHINKYGYGRLSRKKAGDTSLAHRISYEQFVGPIPDGFQIDHLCRVRNCVNPAHLEPVIYVENRRRRAVHQTHCKNGHPFDDQNTYIQSDGARACRICRRDFRAEYEVRKRFGGGIRIAERFERLEKETEDSRRLIAALRFFVSDEQYLQAQRMAEPLSEVAS